MTDFVIIEGKAPDDGAPVFMVLDSAGKCQGLLGSFDDAKARALHLRGVRAMHDRMYGNDLPKRHNYINY